MSAYTLLEIVQDIHNDLNLDLVNSIGATTESERVAMMAKSVYFEFMARRDWPHLRSIGELLNASSLTEKTTLLLPENMNRLEWLTYNQIREPDLRDRRHSLHYRYPDEFIHHQNNLISDRDNIEEMISRGGARFLIRNDRQPHYWTSFDDGVIVLDAYDSAIESTVQGNKTQALMFKTPEWVMSDEFVPDIPVDAFPGYLAELKSTAALRINETTDSKAEQQAVRQQRRLSNQAWRTHGGIRKPNYGRVGRGSYSYTRNPLFGRDC